MNSYGIDLGTTNSAIARFDGVRTRIIKNNLGGDTTPSCVSISPKGRILVGQKAYTQLSRDKQNTFLQPEYSSNTFVEFKRVMGSDETFFSSHIEKSFLPEELSSEVLKELKKYVLDDDVVSAVITVPAMFDNNQKDATKKAAKLAGFKYYELIQEPVAASISYGIESKIKNGFWLVFDFGGGTFDSALMKMEDGIMRQIDTAGDNHLGGKDIDLAIIDQILMPYFQQYYNINDFDSSRLIRFREMWKNKAEEAKIRLSYDTSYCIETDGDDYGQDLDGNEFELTINITQEMLRKIAEPIFQKAINITKGLMLKNGINTGDIKSVILVGGPTHSPILRDMLRQQVSENVDTSIDPMTCVACGAALYASTLQIPESVVEPFRDCTKVQLDVNAKKTSVEDTEFVSVKLLVGKCENFVDDSVLVEIQNNNGTFSSGKVNINNDGEVFDIPLENEKTNLFTIRCYDKNGNSIPCEPSVFSIIHGIDGVGDSIMPMTLGIGVSNKDGEEVFMPINGCLKNQMLPSDGIVSGLTVPKNIRAGFLEDDIRISVYQADDYSENTKTLYCNHLYDVHFTGDDIPSFLPIYSEIFLHIHADKSGTVDRLVVNIPYLDFDLDITDRITANRKLKVSSGFITNEISSLKRKAKDLGADSIIHELFDIESEFKCNGESRDTSEKITSRLKNLGKKIDEAYSSGEWIRVEKELRRVFEMVSADAEKYGNSSTKNIINQFKIELDRIIRKKDCQGGREIKDKMLSYDYQLAEVDFFISWIMTWEKKFDTYKWTDPQRAKQLLSNVKRTLSANPTADSLRPYVKELSSMLPQSERPTDILAKM